MKINIKHLLDLYLDVQTDDEILLRRNRTLLVLLLVVQATAILSLVQVLVFFPYIQQLVMVILAIVFVLPLMWFARRGHHWPPYVFIVFITMLILYMSWDDLYSPMLLSYAVPIVMVPLVAEPWLAVPIAGIEVIFFYLFAFMTLGDTEELGLLPVILLGILGTLSWLSSSTLQSMLQEVVEKTGVLTATNQELEEGQKLLEQRAQALEQHTAYLRATSEVARSVASELELQDLLDQTVRLISERFGFYHTGIFLIDETGRWADLRAASSVAGREHILQGFRLDLAAESLVARVIARGIPQVVQDVTVDIETLGDLKLPGVRSVLTLPLRAQGQSIGALDVYSDRTGALAQEETRILQILAGQVAVAIRNARLFEQLQANLEALQQSYGEFSREAWRRLLRSRTDLAYTSREVGGTEIAEGAWPLVAVQALQTGRVVEGQAGATSGEGDKIPLAIPVKSSTGQVIGVIDTYKPVPVGEWTLDEKSLVQEVAERLAGALESAQFYYESQRRAVREQLTREISSRVRETLDVETVLQTAAREIGESLGLEDFVIRVGTVEQLIPYDQRDATLAAQPPSLDIEGDGEGSE